MRWGASIQPRSKNHEATAMPGSNLPKASRMISRASSQENRRVFSRGRGVAIPPVELIKSHPARLQRIIAMGQFRHCFGDAFSKGIKTSSSTSLPRLREDTGRPKPRHLSSVLLSLAMVFSTSVIKRLFSSSVADRLSPALPPRDRGLSSCREFQPHRPHHHRS